MQRMEAEAGESIMHLVDRAKSYMRENNQGSLVVVHNGIAIAVSVSSVPADIYTIFDMKKEIQRLSAGYRH